MVTFFDDDEEGVTWASLRHFSGLVYLSVKKKWGLASDNL